MFFWHRIEEEGLIQFVLAKLPKHMAANSNVFNLIYWWFEKHINQNRNSCWYCGSQWNDERICNSYTNNNTTEQEYKKSQKICRLEEEILQLQMKIENLDRTQVPLYQVNIMKARKLKLEEDLLKLNTT